MTRCMLCRGDDEEEALAVDNLNPCVKLAVSDSDASIQFGEWAEQCIVSMCRMLKIPKFHPFKQFLLNASYCQNCTQLIRDIDLTLKQLDRLQKDMIDFRDDLVSKLGSNYDKIRNIEDITVKYEDVDPGSKGIINNKQEPYLFDEVVKMIYEKTQSEKSSWTSVDFMRHSGSSILKKDGVLPKNEEGLEDVPAVRIKEEIDSFDGFNYEENFDVMIGIPDVIIPESSNAISRVRKAKRKVDFSKYENEDDSWDAGEMVSPVGGDDISDLVQSEPEDRKEKLSNDPDWSESNSDDGSWNGGSSKSKNHGKKVTRKRFHNQKSDNENESSFESDFNESNSDDGSWYKATAKSKKSAKAVSKDPVVKKSRLRRPYHCPEKNCGQGFNKEHELLTHIRKIHEGDPTPYHCTQCDLKYKSRDKFKWHNKSAHKSANDKEEDAKNNFRCAELTCAESFNSEDALLVHKRKIHEGETHPFHCDECEEKFVSASALKYHKTKHEAGEGRAVCSICNKGYTTVSGMRNHMKRAHNGQDIRKCSFCGFVKTSEKELEDHEAEHKKREVPFSCLECDQHFTSSTDLIHHMVIHDDTRFMCDVCGLLLASKRNLVAHRQVHDETFTKFQCKECGLKCSSRGVLVRHSARHSNERKHVCDKCGKSFKYSSALLLHMRRHNNITPFKCKICGKGFIASHYMKKHEQIHSGILAYQCKICGKRFRAESNLYQHERIHGPNNPNKKPRVRAKPKPKESKNSFETINLSEIEPTLVNPHPDPPV